jgi:putative PIN family toxin of toxin-antitoxin system
VLRAVLDANVIISALIQPKGASGRILASLLQANSFELIVSPANLGELRRSLSYPKVRKYIKFSDEDLASVLDRAYCPTGGWQPTPSRSRGGS